MSTTRLLLLKKRDKNEAVEQHTSININKTSKTNQCKPLILHQQFIPHQTTSTINVHHSKYISSGAKQLFNCSHNKKIKTTNYPHSLKILYHKQKSNNTHRT
jgi:hypothetical protein